MMTLIETASKIETITTDAEVIHTAKTLQALSAWADQEVEEHLAYTETYQRIKEEIERIVGIVNHSAEGARVMALLR